MTGFPSGSFVPGDSFTHRLDPRAKLVGFVLLIAACILSVSPADFLVLFAGVLGLLAASRQTPRSAVLSISVMIPFLLVIFFMNLFFFDPEHAWFGWWVFRPSPGGASQGARIGFRVVLLSWFGVVLLGTTRPIELTSALESLLFPLRLFRLPVAEIAMILSIAVRFVPELMNEIGTIKLAQSSRGADFAGKRLRDRIGGILSMLIPVFLAAFSRADELSLAMEARGYRGAKYRTRKKGRPLTFRDALALLFCASLCAVLVLIP